MNDKDADSAQNSTPGSNLDAAESSQILSNLQVPLETISNLSFLAHESAEYPKQARFYLRMLDEQVDRMAGIMRKILRLPRGQ